MLISPSIKRVLCSGTALLALTLFAHGASATSSDSNISVNGDAGAGVSAGRPVHIDGETDTTAKVKTTTKKHRHHVTKKADVKTDAEVKPTLRWCRVIRAKAVS